MTVRVGEGANATTRRLLQGTTTETVYNSSEINGTAVAGQLIPIDTAAVQGTDAAANTALENQSNG
ncbi:hypothetical protein [Enterococcus mundtii]|uniref:hypothetical protein n=1 Tax=Enterococcus mundtii TaxID=53346 RepID=UPI0035C77802